MQEFYDLSVVENEQFDVECEKVDINRIVTDCLIEKYYEFGEIQPIIQTEKSPVWIYGNNLICKRIIENLICNDFCQVQINGNHHKLYLVVSEGTRKEPRSISSRPWPL